jgi:ABC-type cobalamin/Fe3+-siderophores transport systems, ATPase components
MLEIKNLSVAISGKEIIHDISFSAGKSENISLIGTNGAGKTTLLRAVSSLLKHSGSVLANGAEVDSMSEKERAKLISFVPQGAEITGDFEVSHFLELSRYPYRKPWEKLSSEDRAAIEYALELTDTKKFITRKIGTLSGGERQRVLLAGAIAQESDILLLDEPLTYLDPVQRIGISEIIRKIAASGKLVITVTHEINEALVFSDRILALKEGKLVFDGKPKELVESSALKNLFDSEFITLDAPEGGRPLVFPKGKSQA